MISERRLARFREVLERRQFGLEVVLDNVFDAHNASAVVRTADGFGVGAIDLLYTQEEFPDVSRGVSGYARKWTTFRRFENVTALRDDLHARGLRLLATHVDPGATPYLDVDWTQPVAVALGNEQRGCCDDLIEAADETVTIPMQGMAQSFNVSVAAALVLGEAARQRTAAGLYAPSWDAAKESILQEWIARDEGPRGKPL